MFLPFLKRSLTHGRFLRLVGGLGIKHKTSQEPARKGILKYIERFVCSWGSIYLSATHRMLSGSIRGWREKDNFIRTSRYRFRASGLPLCGFWPTLPGSILPWSMLHTSSLLSWGFPADDKPRDAPGAMPTQPGSVCLWGDVGGDGRVFVPSCGAQLWPMQNRGWWGNSCLFVPHRKDYPETKLYSFLEDSLQGLNEQLHLA